MDELETRRRRLVYRARHRGTQESDLVMGGFADAHVASFGPAELDQFEALVDQSDAELNDWMSGHSAPPDALDGPVFKLLVNFKNSLLKH